MIEVVPLKFGVAFKKAFSIQEIFCQFVEDVLGIKVQIDRIREEYEYPRDIGLVTVRYDLFAEEAKKRIIVEIQHAKHQDFFDRFMHYHLCGIIEQAKSHKKYIVEKTVYTIVVLTTVPKNFNASVIATDFNSIDEYGYKHDIYGHKIIFLTPGLVNKHTPSQFKQWLDLIQDSLDGQVDEVRYQNEALQKVIHEIETSNISPLELAKIKDEAAWEDSKQEAYNDGKIEIAIKLLQEGMSVEKIVKITELPKEKIEKLKGKD